MNPVLSDSSFKSNEDTDSSPTWSFTWESSDNIDRRKPYFLLVEINANSGELINYSISHPSLLATKGKEPISLEKAQQVAEAFLRKHAGKKLSSISLKPLLFQMTEQHSPLQNIILHTKDKLMEYHFPRIP
ncbi:YcdB/YcdC domain-containing protein [Brevibacillus laterosporus]|uniref:YcdB/YcdC domain-containing protein n=1 Tax=Brevibacillus laterosporus TaxID=1465 RepID=UPI003D1E44D8